MFFETKNLCFSYYKKPLCLKDINISFDCGEKIVCLASEGMGKTTFLKVLSSFENRYFGSILLNAKDLKNIRDEDKIFSLILSEVVLFKNKSIKYNLDYFFNINGLNLLANNEIDEFLLSCGINKKFGDKVSKLSLLEKRRFSIFRTLLKKPQILFLDDQFEMLNDSEVEDMLKIYEELFSNKDLTIVATLGQDSYKKIIQKRVSFVVNKVLYLCNANIKQYKNFAEFEEKRDNFDMVVFLRDYESFLADLIFENGKYKIALDGSSECLDKKFYNNLKNIGLKENEIEECLILLKKPIYSDLGAAELANKLQNSEANLYSCLTGEKLI